MAELQKISQEYQLIQNQLSNAVEARQRLDAQLTENEAVWKVCLCRVPMIFGTDQLFP